MAEGKRSFVLYADLIHTVRKMPKTKQADLFMTILSYVNDENPVVEDLIVSLVWEPVKQQLKRDLKDWEEIKKERSDLGRLGNLKRWNNDLYEKVISKEIPLESAEIIAKNRKTSLPDKKASPPIANVAVNDNVTVNVNDNVNDIFNKEVNFSIEHCLAVAMNDDRWVTKNKASPEKLKKFNDYLEGQGIYEYNPAEYKKYYHNWNKKQINGSKTHFGIIKPITGKGEGAQQLLDSLRTDIEASGI